MKQPRFVDITIENLDERGYGVAFIEGVKVLCLNALPQERIHAKIFKKKKGVLMAETETILESSPDRVVARDEAFGSTSPLQIVSDKAELEYKYTSLNNLYMSDVGVKVDTIVAKPSHAWSYRNKIEFSFYADESNSVHLAFHKRGSNKGKIPVTSTSIASDLINTTAARIVRVINNLTPKISAFCLKTLIIRSSQYTQSTVAVLYCKVDPDNDKEGVYSRLQTAFAHEYREGEDAIHIVYSDRRSPASIVSRHMYSQGEWDLVEKIGDITLLYPVDSFFQVNTEVFECILSDIKEFIQTQQDNINSVGVTHAPRLLDLYAGVGTIGIALAPMCSTVHGIELFAKAGEYARKNAARNGVQNYDFQVVSASHAVDSFDGYDYIVVDPPRSGLEQVVITALLEAKPQYIIYVSCNPITQKRDILLLLAGYQVVFARGYDMYPQTPHLESVIILKKV